jgi:hypothetical protein
VHVHVCPTDACMIPSCMHPAPPQVSSTTCAAIRHEGRKVARKYTEGGFRWGGAPAAREPSGMMPAACTPGSLPHARQVVCSAGGAGEAQLMMPRRLRAGGRWWTTTAW